MFLKLFFDYIFLLRPVILVPVWAFAILGFYAASFGGSLTKESLFVCLSFEEIIKILIFSISVGAVNVFNQVADYETDKKNGGFPLLVNISVSKSSAFVYGVVLSLLSILLPLFMKNGYVISIFSIIAIVIGLIYSLKPLYFTGRPFLDFISNAFGFGIVAFSLGWYIKGGNINLATAKYSFSYFLLMAAGSISSTLPDIEGDKLSGKITTAVLLGERISNIIATLFIIVAIAYSFYIGDYIALISGALSVPFYMLYILFPTQLFMEATYKIGGGLLMLIIAIIFPQFALCAVLCGVATVYYFRFRHRVIYPSLLPAGSIDE